MPRATMHVRMLRLRTLILLVLALTHLLLGGIAGHGVLCIEPDGRIGIERDGDLCGGRVGACAGEDESGPALASNECCPCIDIPLPEQQPALQDAKPATVERLLATAVRAEPAGAPAAARASFATLEPARDPPPPPGRSLAVLRC